MFKAKGKSSAPGGVAGLISPQPKVAKEIMDSMQQLRDALEWGIPHRRIFNLRKVLPKVGQRIVISCCSRNLYYSAPGDGVPSKVSEPIYQVAAAPGKQYVVHELTAGDIGKAHHVAAKINISVGDRPPVFAC